MHVVWNTFASSPTMNYDGNVDFYLDGVAWSTNYWPNCALRASYQGGYLAFNNYTRAYPTSGSLGDPFSIYWDDMYIADARVGTSGAMSATIALTFGMSGVPSGALTFPKAGGLGGLG